jgi:hypothetical protein
MSNKKVRRKKRNNSNRRRVSRIGLRGVRRAKCQLKKFGKNRIKNANLACVESGKSVVKKVEKTE